MSVDPGLRYYVPHTRVDPREIKEVTMKLEATKLRNCWVVRPEGALGTCGWSPEPWSAVFVRARTAEEALRVASLRGLRVVR